MNLSVRLVWVMLLCALILWAASGSKLDFLAGTSPGNPSYPKLRLWGNGSTGKVECTDANGLPCFNIAVASPLVFSNSTGQISCPTCVVADGSGNVTISGTLTTGSGGGTAGQIQATGIASTSGKWYVCADSSGNLSAQSAACQ